ncbi:UDP-2,4-diacetamido-2,4,6-trideoxy-beta-L-altropyranose hydrolase [Vreelandella sulfidaeris]|uniref:UDP-2,4-diacetamido-2,4, 6-trideoxy-beta-L-altropyranose hydrolase n=1 Tax=Vreelandella sulfidaeris TaxID=115553 RepID=UPI0035EBA61F
MLVAFRADASVQIGTGHVMRCLTLAEELRRQGHQCLFICRNHEGHLADIITQKGFELHLLQPPEQLETLAKDELVLAHADWLGVPWQTDANQTLQVLSSSNAEWLIVDHYALDAKWERKLAEAVSQIMVIDDLADREHDCAVLLDQNVLGCCFKRRYQSNVNENCRLLLGPTYALLSHEYAVLANALPSRNGSIARILIFVGGSDPFHLTELYLKVLAKQEFSHLSVDVVIGKNYPLSAVIQELVNKRANTQLYSGLPSLAALMVRADLMLGAGGTTNWERMCLGLNVIVASIARNQDKINQVLGNRSLVTFLGKADELTTDAIACAIRSVISEPESNSQRSDVMRKIVDGYGAQYVCRVLTGN